MDSSLLHIWVIYILFHLFRKLNKVCLPKEKTKNYAFVLVLKDANQHYIINGDYTMSTSGIYEAAGTIFDYRRIDGLTNSSLSGYRNKEVVTEWITNTGPITEPIELMVIIRAQIF